MLCRAVVLRQNEVCKAICQSQCPGTFNSIKRYLFITIFILLLRKTDIKISTFLIRQKIYFHSTLGSRVSIRCQSLSLMTKDGKYTKRALVTCSSVETTHFFKKEFMTFYMYLLRVGRWVVFQTACVFSSPYN